MGLGAFAGLLAVAALAGCSAETASDIAFVGLPEPASEEAGLIRGFWNGSWVAAWAVGIFTWGLMIWSFVVYRRRKSDTHLPEQVRYNIPIEVLYTIAPLIVVFGIFSFALRDQTKLLALSDDYENSVQVVGFRWSWGFNYLDDDAYEVGTPQEFPTLWLPVNEKVRFELNSPDVIHSFWVPQWLFKMDVVPGQTNEFEVTPNQLGEFAGKCAELCGVDHARMLFNVKVVTREEYDAHIEELKAKGQTGKLKSDQVLTDEGDVRGRR